MTRRRFLSTVCSLAVAAPATRLSLFADESAAMTNLEHLAQSFDQTTFLNDMQRRCYQYFLEASDPQTGLIADRAAADGSSFSRHASSAACGFGLAAHAVAATNKWRPRGEIAEHVELTLRSLLDKAEHEHGFVYHFFDARTGHRAMNSEASSIDTAILVAGALTAATAFADNPVIVELAEELYRRVEWTWMLGSNNCFHMGWTPEGGMIPHQWDSFSELVLLVLISIGASEHAAPPDVWNAWRREPLLRFGDDEFLSYPPLFVHQYPHAFFDLRRFQSPEGRNYWDNAVLAHHAHVDFLTELGRRFPDQFGHYGDEFWGLTSSDSETGYRDWGGPYETGRYEPDRGIDGTLVPSAAAGGLPIVPELALRTLKRQREIHGEAIYGRYGFVNAYNIRSGWVGPDVIGIDTGVSLLMAENLLSGNVWRQFMQHPAANRALERAGFVPVA